MNDTVGLFEKAPVPQAVLKNTIPAMAAMLMVLIYNLADTFFIAQTRNDILVAAVSLAPPVFLIFMALGTAGLRCSLASWALGGLSMLRWFAPSACGDASRWGWSSPRCSCC